MSKLGPALAAFLLFLGLGVVVLDRAVLSGEVLSSADSVVRNGPFPAGMAGPEERNTRGLGDQHRAFEPWLRFAADEYEETGRLPFWKDTSFCGAPLLGNGQSALFFPPTIVGVMAGAPWWYQGALGLFKLVLGACFAFALARHLGVSSEGAWIAGITFAFFGFQIAWLTFPLTNAAFLLPLVILVADRAVLEPSGRRIALLALVTGLQHTGGHPETVFECQAFAGLLVLVRAASLRRLPGVRVGARVLAVTGGFVLGALIGAVQTLPLLEYLSLSDSLAERLAGEHALPPLSDAPWANLLFGASLLLGLVAAVRLTVARRRFALWGTLLFVAVAGAVIAGMESLLTTNFMSLLAADWQGGRFRPRSEGNYMRASLVYVGPALVLSLAGMLFGRPRPLVRVVGIAFVVLLLVGLRAPLVLHLFDQLPVFSLALNTNLVLISNLGAALLAGFGLDAISDATTRERPLARYLWAVLAPLAALLVALVVGITYGSLGRGTPPVPNASRGPVAAQLESSSFDARGRMQVSGWFDCREPVERCQVVVAAGTSCLARVEPLRPSPSGKGTRYRFEATLPDHIASPRVRMRLWIRGTENLFKSRVLTPTVGWRRILTSFPVLPEGRRAHAQIALFVLTLVGAAWMLARRQRHMPLARLAMVAIVASSVLTLARGFNPSLPRELHYPPSPSFDLLRSLDPDGRALLVNLTPFHETITYYGIPAPLGYDGVSPRVTAQLLRTAFDNPGRRARVNYLPTRIPPDSRLAGAMAVRYLAYPHGSRAAERDPALTLVDYEGGERGFVVAENSAYLPRARIVGSAVVEADDERAWTLLADPAFDLEHSIVLAQGEPLEGEGAPAGEARLVVSEADHVALEVAPTKPGYLILADTFFPGWIASVDGREREILRANVAFRAVRLAPGDERVDFHYRPRSFRIGLWVTGGGLAIALLLALVGRGPDRGERRGERRARRGRPTWGQWYVLLFLLLPCLLAGG